MGCRAENAWRAEQRARCAMMNLPALRSLQICAERAKRAVRIQIARLMGRRADAAILTQGGWKPALRRIWYFEDDVFASELLPAIRGRRRWR